MSGENFASEVEVRNDDVWFSAELAVAAQREQDIRRGIISPRNTDEQRQRLEGRRNWRDLDCVKEWKR